MSPMKHIFGLLEEAKVSRESPNMDKEDITQKSLEMKLGPSHCEAKMLTTTAPCSLLLLMIV